MEPMEPVVRKLTIRGFRSFRSEVVEFDNPTFLVGCNGSGKSNLIDALAFLSEAMVTPLTEVFRKRGGGRNLCHGSSNPSRPGSYRVLHIRIDMGTIDDEHVAGHYAFRVAAMGRDRANYYVEREQCAIEGRDGRRTWFDRVKDETFHSNVGGLQPRLADESLALPLISGDTRFARVFHLLSGMRVYSIEPDKLREWQVPDSGNNLQRDGGNVTSVLREILFHDPDDLRRICELLEAVVPTIDAVTVKEYGSKLALEFTQRWNDGARAWTLEASSMSDGTLRLRPPRGDLSKTNALGTCDRGARDDASSGGTRRHTRRTQFRQ